MSSQMYRQKQVPTVRNEDICTKIGVAVEAHRLIDFDDG